MKIFYKKFQIEMPTELMEFMKAYEQQNSSLKHANKKAKGKPLKVLFLNLFIKANTFFRLETLFSSNLLQK